MTLVSDVFAALSTGRGPSKLSKYCVVLFPVFEVHGAPSSNASFPQSTDMLQLSEAFFGGERHARMSKPLVMFIDSLSV
jgi:hypothetical protein